MGFVTSPQCNLLWKMWLLVLHLVPNVEEGDDDVRMSNKSYHAEHVGVVCVEMRVFTFSYLAELAERETWVEEDMS